MGPRLARRVKERVVGESELAEASAGSVKVHVRRAEKTVGNILMDG